MKIGVIAAIFFAGVCAGLLGSWIFVSATGNLRGYEVKAFRDTVEVKGKADTAIIKN